MIKNIWQGVYRSFEEAPTRGPGFCGERWVLASADKLKALRKGGGPTVPNSVAYSASLLPAIAALVREAKGLVRILDFGGGLGLTYTGLVQAIGGPEGVEYRIVENPAACARGRAEFDGKILFHEEPPAGIPEPDIVHTQSSLQYIRDWKGLLGRLCAYRARYLILTDLPAGDFATYASAQVYYESRIPHWFFNVAEVTGEAEAAGYRLILKTRFLGTYLGVYQDYPQENFPPELRVGKSCNLLFVRR